MTFYRVVDAEDSGVEVDPRVRWHLRVPVHVRESHLDHQGEGETVQEAVRRPRHQETQTHRRPDLGQLQPPSSAVSRVNSKSS